MNRTIDYVDLTCELSDAPLADTDALLRYLLASAQPGDLLLAHSWDGVTWGAIENGQLYLSHEVAPEISPPLELTSLHELRLFSPAREIYLWPAVDHWRQRVTTIQPGHSTAIINEYHVLAGTQGAPLDNGFTLLEEGAQGMHHAVPIDATGVNGTNVRACLMVHHVLHEVPETGLNVIAYSRLAGLEVVDYA